MNLHLVELHDVVSPLAVSIAAAISQARVLPPLALLLQFLHLLAHLLIEFVIYVSAHHAVVFQKRVDLLLRKLLLHLHHPDIRGRYLSLVEEHILSHRNAEMLMLPEGRNDGAISCQTGCEGDGTTVRKLLQVHVLLQLARHRISQRLYPLFQRLGISQHHHLRQINRTGDIIILLSIPIQPAEQGEQDDTVFHVLEPFKHRSKDKEA